MDLIFPLRTRYASPKPRNCSSAAAPALRGLLVQSCRKIPKNVRVRSEFDGVPNGALSADFDPRFLDRVSDLFFSHLFSAFMCQMFTILGTGFVFFAWLKRWRDFYFLCSLCEKVWCHFKFIWFTVEAWRNCY